MRGGDKKVLKPALLFINFNSSKILVSPMKTIFLSFLMKNFILIYQFNPFKLFSFNMILVSLDKF